MIMRTCIIFILVSNVYRYLAFHGGLTLMLTMYTNTHTQYHFIIMKIKRVLRHF